MTTPSYKTLIRRKNKWDLKSTVKSGWNINNITPYLEDIRREYPQSGARDTKKWLLFKKGIRVSRYVLALETSNSYRKLTCLTTKAKLLQLG